jgi:hypothetical protein
MKTKLVIFFLIFSLFSCSNDYESINPVVNSTGEINIIDENNENIVSDNNRTPIVSDISVDVQSLISS